MYLSAQQAGHGRAARPSRRRWRTVLVAVIAGFVLVALAIGAARLWLGGDKATTEKAAAVASATETGIVVMSAEAQQNIALAGDSATIRPIVRMIRTTGQVGFDDTRVVRMRPLARGRLLETKIELGDRVRAGQVIAIYDNIDLNDVHGQVAIARAGLDQARTEADVARRALVRTNELLAIGGVARAEAERRNADNARAVAGVRVQEAELAKLEQKLRRFGVGAGATAPRAGSDAARSPIQAPIDGVVIKISAVPGEIIDVDREVFTIADLSTVWMQADIYERDLGMIRPDLEARVGVAAYPERRFEGRVSYVGDLLDPKTGAARVRCELPNVDGALKLNMFATVEIAVPAGRDGVTVPATALQSVDDQPVVFVRTGPERFERRLVKLGVADRDWIELASGVAAGEAVVTTGSYQLKSILLRDRIVSD